MFDKKIEQLLDDFGCLSEYHVESLNLKFKNKKESKEQHTNKYI